MEEDIKRCKELIKSEHSSWIGISNQKAIENVLADRERLIEERIQVQKEDTYVRVSVSAEHRLREQCEEIQKLKADLHEMYIINEHKKINWIPKSILNGYISKEKTKRVVEEVIELIESKRFKIIMGDMTKVYRIRHLLKELLEEGE